MDSREIFIAIEETAATSKKKEKESLLKEYCQCDEFKEVLKAALDPLITYGVQKTPDVSSFGGKRFGVSTWQLLVDLHERNLTGHAAIDAIATEMGWLDAGSAELLKRIIKKDLRAGFGASTINKACKGLIRTFPYMRCALTSSVNIENWDWSNGIISQEKADGMFANINHEPNGVVSIISRNGSLFPMESFASLQAEVVQNLKENTQTHGELLVFQDNVLLPREKSNGMLNRVLKGGTLPKNCKVVYQAWDQIPLEYVKEKGSYKIDYMTRISDLSEQIASKHNNEYLQLIPTQVVHSIEGAYEHYSKLIQQGKEGTIIKERHGIWKDGTSKHQVKLKLEVDVDLEVAKILSGKVGSKNEGKPGSLTCISKCGKLKVDVTVKNDELRQRIMDDPNDWLGRIIAVRANTILNPSKLNSYYTLFLPRMVEPDYRIDKDIADTLEEIKNQFKAKIAPK